MTATTATQTFGALAALYATRERKAEEGLQRCRRLLREAQARLERARADHGRFQAVVRRQEQALYREIMARIAGKADFETLKERMHLLKLQLKDYLDRALEQERRCREAQAAFEAARAHHQAMLRKHGKLGELRDELRRGERLEALRREEDALDEFRPPPPDARTGAPAAMT